ncbi:MAG TPA: TIGR00282 family metallophosphoesterase [Candidatus Eisenbacteria bacterium]|nr:TIGR00282 family metallophosphoesterase [Candidatus Eisenbacteria bacterium]
MNLLFIADIYGSPGRKAVRELVPDIVSSMGIDFVVGNVENSAAGFGVTKDILEELKELGLEAMTSGNHIWDRRESLPLLDSEPLLLRPHNYPEGVPGTGSKLFTSRDGVKIGVLNLMGRVFMRELLCPFRVADQEVARLRDLGARIILLDFHAEATAEKVALGWYLDGRISALLGTHTHIQTADERVLPKGTGYITDAGMTGPYDSVIGVRKELAIQKFLTLLPTRFEPATGDIRLNGVHLDVDEVTGHCRHIERISLALSPAPRVPVA